MYNLLTQVGAKLSGNSRQPTSTTHTNSNQQAVESAIEPDFRDSSDDNDDDDLQKHLKSSKFKGVTKRKEKQVTFENSIDTIIEEAAKRVKSGDVSGDSSEDSDELDKEASVPATKRRKLNDGKSEKS